MSFFKNLFGKGEPKGEPFIATPTQSVPGLESIIVQAIENLYPDAEDQKQVFQWALNYKKELKRNDTKGVLAMLAYSEGKIQQLPHSTIWLDGHFRGEMTDPIFPKMTDAEECVKSITKLEARIVSICSGWSRLPLLRIGGFPFPHLGSSVSGAGR